jgi:hypothetical protein
MQTADAVVRLQTLSGQWETCGSDRLRGIVPEGIQLQANANGPDTASFALRRDPAAIWPDLQAFTPVEIEIGGVIVWDGFINQTPTTETDGGSFNVNCKGWQYHLDDDSFEKVWTHSSLPAWKEIASFTNYDPTRFPPAGAVSVGDGAITLGWSTGNYIVKDTFSAILLDLGPENKATGLSVSWEVPDTGVTGSVTNSTSGNMKVFGRAGTNVASLATISNDAWSSSYMKGNKDTCTLSGAFPVPARYVMIAVGFVGTTTTAAASVNYSIKIKEIIVTTDSAVTRAAYPQKTISPQTPTYPTAGQVTLTTSTAHGFAVGDWVSVASVLPVGYNQTYKVLAVPSTTTFTVSTSVTGATTSSGFVNKAVQPAVTASKVVGDAIAKAPLLSQRKNQIKDTSFVIPSLGSIDGAQTPREYINIANSYHDNIFKVAPGSRELIFKQRPVDPSYVIGRWGGATFEDASAASSEEIYNKVIVEGDGPDGAKLRVTRYAGMQQTALGRTGIQSSIYNGTFVGPSTSGWSATDSTALATATTPVIGTAQPSLKWTPNSSTLYATLTGAFNLGSSRFTFKGGTTYTLSFTMASYYSYFPGIGFQPKVDFGALSTIDYATTPSAQTLGTGNMASPTSAPLNDLSVSVTWTPAADTADTAVSVRLTNDAPLDYATPGTDFYLIDDVNVTSSTATLVDKYQFFRTMRLQVNAPVTVATAQQLGDTFLDTHMTTPLKGNVNVTAGGVRDYLAGDSIHPSQLLLEVGEKIHLSHRINPDTGSQGRDGDIAQVSYDHTSQTAQVSIDNQRTRFEALLARLAVVTNNGLGR